MTIHRQSGEPPESVGIASFVPKESTDILAATAAALGWAVGQLEAREVDVPSWVSNALSDATKPCQESEFRRRLARQRGAPS